MRSVRRNSFQDVSPNAERQGRSVEATRMHSGRGMETINHLFEPPLSLGPAKAEFLRNAAHF
jgi:hypothetical protein